MTVRFGSLPATIATFSESHPGVAMVALFPSDEKSKELATDGGTPESNIHTTVLYLGDTADIEWARGLVPQLVASVATEVGPISGVLSRLSHFGPDDGKIAVVLELDSPAIHDLHNKVKFAFRGANVSWSKKFPEYRPHVTLGYWPEDEVPKQFADPGPLDVPIPVTFSTVSVVWDDKRTDSTLSKEPVSTTQEFDWRTQPRDAEGQWTRIGGYFTGIKRGGVSVDLRNSKQPSRGFALARTKGITIPEDEAFEGNDLNVAAIARIDQFVMLRRRELFSTSARHPVVLGVFHDAKNGTVDVDVTDILPERTDPAKVVALGLKRNQKSAWNLHDGVLIEIGGTGSVRALKADAGNVAEELSGPPGERAEGALGGPVSPGEAQEEIVTPLFLLQPLEFSEGFSFTQPLEFHGVNTHNEDAHGDRGGGRRRGAKFIKKANKIAAKMTEKTKAKAKAAPKADTAPKADKPESKNETSIEQPKGGSGIKGPGPQAGNQQESIEYVHEKAEEMFVNDLTNEGGDLLLPTFEGLSAKQQAKYEKHLKEVLGLSDEDIQQMYDNLDAAAAKSTAEQGNWYRKENKWGLGVSKRSGVPAMYVFGAIALLSGQRKWSGNNSANKEVAERLIMGLKADEPIEVTAKDARKYNAHYTKPDKNGNPKKKNVILGYTPLEAGTYHPSELTSHQLAAMNPWQINSQSGAVPVHQAIMMLRDEITINQALTGPKQRSFTMNLTYPERPNISTNDIWHYRAIAGDIEFLLPDKSKTPTGEWLNPDPNDPSKPEVRRMTLAEFETFITKWTKKRDPDTGENIKDPETGEDLLIPQRSNTPQTLFQSGLASKPDKLKGVGFYPWITKITDEAAARFTKKLKAEGKMPEGMEAIIASDFQARVWKVAGGDD